MCKQLREKKLGDFSILSMDDKNSFSYGTPPMAALTCDQSFLVLVIISFV